MSSARFAWCYEPSSAENERPLLRRVFECLTHGIRWPGPMGRAPLLRQNDETVWVSALSRHDRHQGDIMGWLDGGNVDGEEAKTKQQGERLDAIWGGSAGNTPGDGHGHIVSNDGVNADYVRLPGMAHDEYVVDNRQD